MITSDERDGFWVFIYFTINYIRRVHHVQSCHHVEYPVHPVKYPVHPVRYPVHPVMAQPVVPFLTSGYTTVILTT
jgi:hypothetical protein